jgi:uncharacterized membrane protein YjjP (DUF1212 family)
MAIDFLKYLCWAAIQHILVITPVYFAWMGDPLRQSFVGVMVFSVIAHFGNWLLTWLTFLLSAVFYPLFFYRDEKILVASIMVVIHALVGTYLKRNGYEMRVWRF